MHLNKYIFAGVKLELKSEKPLVKEERYPLFCADFEEADYSLSITTTDNLPSPCGVIAMKDKRHTLYRGERDLFYTVFYDTLKTFESFGVCKVDNSEMYISLPDGLREMVVFDGLDLPTMLLQKGVGIVHSSFIEYSGEAILFVGDKQVGKSTQAALWKEYKNAEIINGDRAAIYCENGIFYADGIPYCGTSGICVNKKLPIKAVVCLSKGSMNEVEKLDTFSAFLELIGKFTYNSMQENVEKMTDLVTNIAGNLPIYKYSCKKDESAVDFLYSRIYGE